MSDFNTGEKISFHQHVKMLEEKIGGKTKRLEGEKYGLVCYVRPAAIADRMRSYDLTLKGSNILGSLYPLLERGMDENGNLLFPDEESRKKAMSSTLLGPFIELGKMILDYDEELMMGAKDKFDEALKNSLGQQGAG